jgi:hypothetical protein
VPARCLRFAMVSIRKAKSRRGHTLKNIPPMSCYYAPKIRFYASKIRFAVSFSNWPSKDSPTRPGVCNFASQPEALASGSPQCVRQISFAYYCLRGGDRNDALVEVLEREETRNRHRQVCLMSMRRKCAQSEV